MIERMCWISCSENFTSSVHHTTNLTAAPSDSHTDHTVVLLIWNQADVTRKCYASCMTISLPSCGFNETRRRTAVILARSHFTLISLIMRHRPFRQFSTYCSQTELYFGRVKIKSIFWCIYIRFRIWLECHSNHPRFALWSHLHWPLFSSDSDCRSIIPRCMK